LARKHNVETPIMEEVYAMLYEGKDVRQAVQDLKSAGIEGED
jgi:glycerol-3-phosphate dehydrogenase